MSFYSGLRDDTAAPLIAQFGQQATYRVYRAETYDNVTGKAIKGTATDTRIVLLDLPVSERDFSAEVMARASAKFLVAAAQFAAASVVPAVNETVILRGKNYRILAINSFSPSGEAVIYKMAVENV